MESTPPVPAFGKSEEARREHAQTLLGDIATAFFPHLMTHCIATQVTDLHLADGERPTKRLARDLSPLPWPEELQRAFAEGNWEVLRSSIGHALGVEGEFPPKAAFNYDNRRIRLCSYRAGSKQRLAMRFQPKEPKTLEELSFPKALRDELVSDKPGLILISGGACAGKTTTLFSILNEINHRRGAHIRTMEDPVEYELVGDKSIITQQTVGSGQKADVANYGLGVEEALMQDVNVIAIGEIKDLDTLKAAIKAANLNLTVYATIHAPDVDGTIGRVLQDFPEADRKEAASALARCLRVVVAQKLKQAGDGLKLTIQAGVFDQVQKLRERITDSNARSIAPILREPESKEVGCVDEFRGS